MVIALLGGARDKRGSNCSIGIVVHYFSCCGNQDRGHLVSNRSILDTIPGNLNTVCLFFLEIESRDRGGTLNSSDTSQ